MSDNKPTTITAAKESVRYCVDCKHFRANMWGDYCALTIYRNLTGQRFAKLALSCREHGECGQDAKNFEPKLTLWQRISMRNVS